MRARDINLSKHIVVTAAAIFVFDTLHAHAAGEFPRARPGTRSLAFDSGGIRAFRENRTTEGILLFGRKRTVYFSSLMGVRACLFYIVFYLYIRFA